MCDRNLVAAQASAEPIKRLNRIAAQIIDLSRRAWTLPIVEPKVYKNGIYPPPRSYAATRRF
jgi:hypothetical protein